jgi:phage replication-related protein YjqB (UPF0714/DUF867 family)
MAGAKRRDKYPNFEMLRGAERADDFRIDCRLRPSAVAIIAPHGGKIEPGTSNIAAAIAANDYCLYRFEGRKPRENRDLHITSTHFDEPECLTLISACDHVVAVHGCEGEEQVVYMGGLELCLRDAIRGGDLHFCNKQRGVWHRHHAGIQHAAALPHSRSRTSGSSGASHF